MKIILFIFLLFPSLTIPADILAQDQREETEINEDWQLSKDKDDIRIYTRWIEAEENRKARQMHAVMTVDASLSASVYALKNEHQVKEWLNRNNEYYHFDVVDDYNWHAYTEFSIPWPLKNLDLVTRVIMSQEPYTKSIRVEIKNIADKLPVKDNINRISHFEGSWEFTRVSKNRIKIDYFVFTKTEPFLPRWIIDPIVGNGLWNTFDQMRINIRNNHDKGIKLAFILQ